MSLAPRVYERYLARQKPTAVLFGCCWATAYLQRLVASGELSVPSECVMRFGELSVEQGREPPLYPGGFCPAS